MISNIAWDSKDDIKIYEYLQEQKIKFLEIAPTKIASWDELTENKIKNYIDELKKYDIEIYSLQSITLERII